MTVDAKLAHDAAEPAQFATDGLPEVAIAGRSNSGKSSLINRLTGRKQLARTSGSPGKTRRIHFYRLDAAAYLVDLPGYGFARVSKRERGEWRPLVESYLRGDRDPLRGCILVVDLRRGPESEEMDLLDWLRTEGIAARMVLTKSDKLKRGEIAVRVREIRDKVSLTEGGVAAVSSKSGVGLAEPARWIREWTGLELRRPDGGSF